MGRSRHTFRWPVLVHRNSARSTSVVQLAPAVRTGSPSSPGPSTCGTSTVRQAKKQLMTLRTRAEFWDWYVDSLGFTTGPSKFDGFRVTFRDDAFELEEEFLFDRVDGKYVNTFDQ